MADFKVRINGSSGNNTGKRFRIKSINYGTNAPAYNLAQRNARKQAKYEDVVDGSDGQNKYLTLDLDKQQEIINRLGQVIEAYDNWEIHKAGSFNENETKKSGTITYYNKEDEEAASKARNEYFSRFLGDKTIDDFREAYARAKQDYNLAKYAQEKDKQQKNYDAILSNEDFEEYSVAGESKTVRNGSNFTGDLRYDYINDINNGRKVGNALNTGGIFQNYEYLTDSEIGVYNYLYAKEGKEKADEYLDFLEDTLDIRRGQKMYEGIEEKTLAEILFSVPAGLNQFGEGMKNLFNSKDEYIPPSATQYASSLVREDLADNGFKIGDTSIAQVAYDFGTTTSNMLPSILTSAVVSAVATPATGAAVGSTLMGASAAGNAYAEMLNLGYDKGQARTYSALVGASEAGLQYLLGGIGKLGGKLTGTTVEKIVSGIDNAYAKIAIKYGGQIVSEGGEEALQEILTPFFENIAAGYNVNDWDDIDWEQVAYSGILGALSGSLFNAPETISEIRSAKSSVTAEDAAVAKQTNAISNPLSSYSAEKQSSIRSFIGAVDEKLKSFVQSVKSGDLTFKRQKISDVSERAANDIGNLLGIDVSGYTHDINTGGVRHILNRHGENGEYNQTMSNDDDIARIGWVLENYDMVELLTKDGEQVYSSGFLDSEGNPAPQIRYIKRIDGTYYVVEAAVENNYKKLWVQSAYLQKTKEDVTRTAAEGNSTDHDTNARSASVSPSSNNTVPQSAQTVNNNIPESGGENSADTNTQPDGAAGGITELSAADLKKDAFQLAMEDVIGYKELSEEQKTIRDIGRKLGWKVEFGPVRTPKGGKADGKISFATKTITIDPTSKKPIQFILKHELAHSLEQNKEAYTELQNAIMDSQAFKDYVKAQGFASVSAYNADIVARYKAEGVQGFDSTKAEYKANCEIVANFVGDCLFGGNVEVTARLLEGMNTAQRRSFTEWVKDFYAKIRAKLTGKHQQLTDEISRLEEAFLKTLNSVETKENTAENDGESYSIATDSKNRKVVVLDRNIFNGVVDLKARAEALEDWIINNFGGTKHNTSDYFFVVMNERTAGKMKFWNENMDAVAYERKLSAAEHIDELIKISKFDRYSKNVKDKHKAFANKGWNYFKSYFTDGKRVYEADISVAKSNEQSVVYNIGYIKDVGQYEPNNKSSYSLTGSPNESVTIPENEASNRNSTDRIPQKEGSVNSNSMQESDEYSISTEYSLKNVLEQVEKGKISAKEAETLLSRKKTLNPAEIANMKEEDANTTPKLKRRQGENRGDRESKFYKSLMGSSIFDDTFKQEAAGDSFIQKYQSVTNSETLQKAAEALDEGGEEYVKRWKNIEPEQASLIDTAVGFILMDRYQRVGDYQSAIFAAEKVKAFGTAGGQKIQLFSILSRLDPNTMVIYSQRELSRAFNILQKKRTQKWIDENAARFNLNEEEIEFIRRRTLQAAQLPEGRDKAMRLAEIAALLQDKLPPERGQGVKALQRVSMLLNPKTIERNIVGNLGMVPVFIASDFFGSGIDRIVSKQTGVRTTGMFDPKSVKGFAKGAFESMDDFRRHINTRNEELNRFETGRINTSGKAFNDQHTGRLAKQLNDCAKVLNALDRFTSFCLELGDRPFYEMWYVNSINNQLKLNNATEATPEMIQIACLEALQRTWQDTNAVVKAVTGAKKVLNAASVGGYGLGDIMIKFVKTPANLTKAIVDFSPAGVVKAIAVDARNLRNAIEKGQFETSLQKKFVDSFSKGIAGSMLYVLAAALASAGMLSGAGDEDKDVSNFEKYIQGIPEYSIKLFGKWWSYDWMQPVGSVFATVADYMKSKEENPDSKWYEDILEAIRAGGEVLYNQSFMQSIQNLFTADNIIDGIIDSVLDDPSVYVPQIVSQIANVTDDYRRVTYEAGKPFETALNNVKLKIPGLRQTLDKQVDVLGRDVPNSQGNVFNAFFNPGNTYTDTSNAVTDEVYALFKRTGELSVIPRKAPYSITKAGITRQLTAEQTNDYQRLAGNTSAELLEVIFDSTDYAELDDAQKVDLVTKVYDYAAKYAKAQLDIYDYELLSAIEGTDKNGDPILSESLYNRLDEKAKQILIDEAFYSKAELKCKGDTEKLVKLFMKQVKE